VALTHQTTVYDVDACYVFPLVSDPTAGPSPTYGTGVRVQGISQVKVDPNFITAELKGDGGAVLAKRGRVDRFKFSGTYGYISFDVLAVILGGSATDPDTHTAQYDFIGGQVLTYFGMALLFEDVDTESGLSSMVVYLPKVQITGGTLITGQTDQFGQPTFDAEAFRPHSFTRMMRVQLLDSVPTLPLTMANT